MDNSFSPEQQYLRLLSDVLHRGESRTDRTGVGTRSLFGAMARFDLSDGSVPVITTKTVYWRTAIKEMLWFLSGKTNIRDLLEHNVRIWTDWPLARYRRETGEKISQFEFEQRILEDRAFAEKWGDLGPVYGKQWRRWQGPDGQEYDQIKTLIKCLRTNPSSRRMLFHGWNVAELDSMALPPCHMVYQFYVTNDGRLCSLMFQRSVDLMLGCPFNWVGQAALQHMLAQQADLELGEMVWMAGDVHIYKNHIDQVKEQLRRQPRSLPKLEICRKPGSIDGYRIQDFQLHGYDPHPAIRAPVAV